MKVLLLANQPESTTRLQLFRKTLQKLGYTVVVPHFSTRNWFSIARQSRNVLIREKPDIVQVFNVPDIIYRNIPKMKRTYFRKFIYDYRSPWGIENGILFGPAGTWIGEYYEKRLASHADAITSVNNPLMNKIRSSIERKDIPFSVIPNYPTQEFISKTWEDIPIPDEDYILFIGRISKQEGIDIIHRAIQNCPDFHFLIIGDGPFSWFFLRKKYPNARYLGWQSHDLIPGYIRHSSLCIKPTHENSLTPYATDRSVWKLNEYLNVGKLVIASGIVQEEMRKNLILVPSSEFITAIRGYFGKQPSSLNPSDIRTWEQNEGTIKKLFDQF